MDVTMPDGTVIQGVPDGVTKAQLSAKYSAHLGKAASAPEDESFGGKASALLSGIKQGVYDIPQSVVELGARGLDATGLTDNSYKNVHGVLQDANNLAGWGQTDSRFYKGGRIVGQIGATAPLAELRVASAAGRLPMLARAANGAVQGAAGAALTSNSTDAPLGEQVGLGATVGGALPVVGRAAARAFEASNIPAASRALLNEGIPLSIGQTLGGGAKATEDKLTSVPILGGMIRTAQGRSTQALNRAVYNRALAPIGQAIPANVETGRAAVDHVATQLGDAYDTLLPQLTLTADHPLVTDLQTVVRNAQANLPEPQFNRLQGIIQNQIVGKAGQGNSYSGDVLQGIHSELGRLSAGLGGDPSFDQRELGNVVSELQETLHNAIARQNPAHAPRLAAINEGYANFSRLRRAAQAVGARDGVFSAPQLANAVRAADQSVGKGAYARGNAMMQDLSDPANLTLPSSVPDSGTAGRGMLGAMLLGGAALSPKVALPAVAGAALYSRPGQAILRGIAARQGNPAAASALRSVGMFGGSLGATLPQLLTDGGG